MSSLTALLTWKEEHLPFADLNVLELPSLDLVSLQPIRCRRPLRRLERTVQHLERHSSFDLVEPLLGLVDVVIWPSEQLFSAVLQGSCRGLSAPLREFGPPTTMMVKSPPSYL